MATYPQIEDAINTLLEEAFYEPTTGPESPELIAAMQQATEGLFGGG